MINAANPRKSREPNVKRNLAVSASLVTLLALTYPSFASVPVVSSVTANASLTELLIVGARLTDNNPEKHPLKVFLGSYSAPLTVLSASSTQVTVALPIGTQPGSFLLSAYTKIGDGIEEFWVTIGAVGPSGATGSPGAQGPQGLQGRPAGRACGCNGCTRRNRCTGSVRSSRARRTDGCRRSHRERRTNGGNGSDRSCRTVRPAGQSRLARSCWRRWCPRRAGGNRAGGSGRRRLHLSRRVGQRGDLQPQRCGDA